MRNIKRIVAVENEKLRITEFFIVNNSHTIVGGLLTQFKTIVVTLLTY